ncbi:CapA family protein [Candidatus Nomurabacteria bacterium]|nr:CapA family protein [Candidatus Nomurabacteria bacterium]
MPWHKAMKKFLYIIFGIIVLVAPFLFFEKEEVKEIGQLATQIPAYKDPEYVKLIFGGDMMLDRGVKASVTKNLGGDYNRLFENLGLFKNFDIVFANLEGPVSDKGRDKRNLYSFRMDPAILPALKNAGITAVSVANNHVGDWGRSAYIDSLEKLKITGILFTGGGMDGKEAETPTIIEKNGIKIGFLGFSDVGPNDMEAGEDTAGLPAEAGAKAGLLLAHNPRFDEIVKNASDIVDYLVVSFHWGDEYKPIHDKRQEFLAHKAVDNGAKIIIGHHPHVVQDFEIYKESFVAYSLGNLIFDQSWSEPTMKGMLLEIKLSKDGNMTVRKDPFKLNNFFQPDEIILGAEEKIEFKKAN